VIGSDEKRSLGLLAAIVNGQEPFAAALPIVLKTRYCSRKNNRCSMSPSSKCRRLVCVLDGSMVAIYRQRERSGRTLGIRASLPITHSRSSAICASLLLRRDHLFDVTCPERSDRVHRVAYANLQRQ